MAGGADLEVGGVQLLRVAWRTVGSIATCVNADIDATVDRLDGLRRIAIDEISYKRGHRYLIVVVGHDTGRLVWAGPGRSDAALNVFFDELDKWLSWARRSQLPAFVKLAKRIRVHRAAIDAALEHRLSNALVESTNTKIRLLSRVAFDFHGSQPLMALALLALGGHPPRLPGRT